MSPTKAVSVLTCISILIPIAVSLKWTCPSQEDLLPCSCEEHYSKKIVIRCRGLNNEQDLVRMARNLRGYDVWIIEILNSTFNYIPHDAFKGVNVKSGGRLNIENSTFMALTDTDKAFVGLEGIDLLRIFRCSVLNEVDWSIFRDLNKLRLLYFMHSHLETIGKELMALSSLKTIFFDGSGIATIDDLAFSTMKDITDLYLNRNQIKDLKRSMLPNPALELNRLEISYNQIEKLPDDMFTNMPNLIGIKMTDNKILVLNENTYSPLWEQLQYFYITDNPLRCDCRMSWLLENRFPPGFIGTCDSPLGLKGKHVIELKHRDLWCY